MITAAEEPLTMGCAGETLIGVLHLPSTSAAQNVGVVILVGGPQYRAGSHRQFLRIARSLAGSGYPVLRFDVRGMGDSTGAQRSFDHLGDDTAAAIDAMMHRLPNLDGVVLLGLCDGASAALLYLADRPDPRVHGLCLMNPWVRSAASQARTTVKHYYTRRMREPEFWAKLFSGKVATKALRELMNNLLAAGKPAEPIALAESRFQDRMAAACMSFPGATLLILSGDDFTAKEFVEFTGTDTAWVGLWNRPALTRLDLPRADHTFSDEHDHGTLVDGTIDWLSTLRVSFQA